jgi:hypothetical protein
MVTDEEIETFVESTKFEILKLKEDVQQLKERLHEILRSFITALHEFDRRLNAARE